MGARALRGGGLIDNQEAISSNCLRRSMALGPRRPALQSDIPVQSGAAWRGGEGRVNKESIGVL